MRPTALSPLSPPEPPRVFGAPTLHTDGELVALGIAGDGILWSLEEPGELRGWNLTTRRQVFSRPLDVAAMIWNFNWAARLIASASDEITIWEVRSGDMLASWPTPAWITSLAFQPGAAIVGTGHEDGSVRVWNWNEQSLLAEFHRGDWPVSAIAFNWDGTRLASAGEDKLVHLWDLTTRQYIGTLEGHKDRVPAILWHPDNQRIFTAAWDTTVRVWNADTLEPIILLNSHATQVLALALSADGKLLASADSDNAVHIWDTDQHETLTVIREPVGEIRCLAFTPDDGKGNLTPANLAWGGADRVIHLWDSRQAPAGAGTVDSLLHRTGIALGPAGRKLFSLGSGTDLRIWDLASGESVASLEGDPQLRAFALSPDGKWVAASRFVPGDESEKNSLALYRADTGALQTVCEGQKGPITALAFSQDGSLFASGGMRSSDVWVWRPGSPEPLLLIAEAVDDCSVEALAFQPGTTLLAVAGIDWLATSGRDGQVALWNIERKELSRTLKGGSTALVFHPTGKWLASAGLDRVIRLWNMETGEVDREWPGQHLDTVTCLAISADGRYLASGSDDRVLRLWELETGEPVGAWELDNGIKGLTFSADGKFLFTGNGNTSCYQIEVDQVLAPLV